MLLSGGRPPEQTATDSARHPLGWRAALTAGQLASSQAQMESRCAVSPDAEPWVAVPRRGRLARDPLQISETVLDPVIYLVRHSRSTNCGRGSTPAATAKDTERARVRAHRYGYPYRNTERNSGAEQHFRDHQMPNRWSWCMRCSHCSLRRTSRWSCHLSHRSMNLSSILSIAITMLGVR